MNNGFLAERDEGESTLMPIYNYLIDIDKINTSIVETLWLNSRGGLHVNEIERKDHDKFRPISFGEKIK